PRAAAAETGRDRYVLTAIDGERDRKSLHRGREPRLPQGPAGPDVDRAKRAIQIADEGDASCRRQHRREERRPLLERPGLPHGVDVEGGQLADVAVRARHLVEAPIRAAGTPAAGGLRNRLRADREAALADRNDQLIRRPV